MRKLPRVGGLIVAIFSFAVHPDARADVIVGHGLAPALIGSTWSVSDLEGRKSWAQAFTTPVSFRYELTSVKTAFSFTAGSVGATLWNSVSDPGDGLPRPGATLIADLGVQSFTGMEDRGAVTYPGRPGMSLNPRTTYWLVFTPVEEGALIYSGVVNYSSHDINAAQIGTGKFGPRAMGDVAKNDWLILPGAHGVTVEGKVVPEPTTIAFILLGLAVLSWKTHNGSRRSPK